MWSCLRYFVLNSMAAAPVLLSSQPLQIVGRQNIQDKWGGDEIMRPSHAFPETQKNTISLCSKLVLKQFIMQTIMIIGDVQLWIMVDDDWWSIPHKLCTHTKCTISSGMAPAVNRSEPSSSGSTFIHVGQWALCYVLHPMLRVSSIYS